MHKVTCKRQNQRNDRIQTHQCPGLGKIIILWEIIWAWEEMVLKKALASEFFWASSSFTSGVF